MPGGAPGQGARAGGPAGDRGPGNGTVFVGSKGYMATCNRGEGVWLLPASRWADYRLPPQMLQRGINHQQDWIRACKGGAPGVSEFAVACKYIEWLVLGAVALRVPGKAAVGCQEHALHQQRRSQQVPQAGMAQGLGAEALVATANRLQTPKTMGARAAGPLSFLRPVLSVGRGRSRVGRDSSGGCGRWRRRSSAGPRPDRSPRSSACDNPAPRRRAGTERR